MEYTYTLAGFFLAILIMAVVCGLTLLSDVRYLLSHPEEAEDPFTDKVTFRTIRLSAVALLLVMFAQKYQGLRR